MPQVTGTSREAMQRLELHIEIAELYLRGHSQAEIAVRVKKPASYITAALNAIRDVWSEWAAEAYDRRLCKEVAKLDRMEREMWDAWERSKRDAERRTDEEDLDGAKPPGKQPVTRGGGSGERGTSEKGGRRKRTITVEGQCGDTRYMELAYKCIDTRLRLLGAYKEKERDGNVFFVGWDNMLEPTPISDPMEHVIAQLPHKKIPSPEGVIQGTAKVVNKAVKVDGTKGNGARNGH
jgi:hypothetical protein